MHPTNVALPAELERQAQAMEQEAEALLEAAQKLRDAADVLLAVPKAKRAAKKSCRRPPKRGGKTRRDQLRDFVQSRGRVTRQEAIQESGLPKGTVGALLTRPHGFEQDEEGRWYWPTGDEDNEQNE